ncbi:MAG TPA: glycerophosphodiester phosphodiesterase family protein [Candidatus Binataceae bacterium]|nr:glycerophosphodiester phosphodiesterase family protein [Candidatus Binataceae bacterium]
MLNIAHRGSSGTHPENTIAAFLAAANEGADMCELDVQATRDGAVVVIHDDSVDRTTDGHGAVAALTLAEIQRLDASFKFPAFRGERIPTLDEVMKATRSKLGLNIEIKEGAVEREVCELMRTHGALGTSMVSSFEWRALEAVRAIDPNIRIGLLAEKNREALLDGASALSAYAVNPRFDMVDTAFCANAHARGLKVLVWTVDAPEAMRILIDAGVDGIMTNYPARLRDVLAVR